ncbi:MAG: D-alanyl-D-alanine carboxypeptidase [Clostridia bacterium]|nr:D-alanyl-D-alanine carboxypeptidase [Clostridia bacterium]
MNQSIMKFSRHHVVKKILLFFLTFIVLFTNESRLCYCDELMPLESEAAVLMEASTGTVIYEKASDTPLYPASITKIMTLLLIFDALESGKINLTDQVSVSEYAASMGGSQVFLEPYEVQDVKTMIKCIAVASANDACVAMAEHIAQSEDVFISMMNTRAQELGMKNTTFKNCTGLDVEGHMSSAYDVALMSRELITKYPQIEEYSMIWMENIIHHTKRGDSEFGLTNTNKLVRQYPYTTGLKTGSTSMAKYCVSATAKNNGMEMIAVIMAAPDHKIRFKEAVALLNYGFGNSQLYHDPGKDPIDDQRVTGGMKDWIAVQYMGGFRYLAYKGEDISTIKKEIRIQDSIKAPAEKGDVAGEAVYMLGNKEIGRIPIVYAESVEKANYFDCFIRALQKYFYK